MTAARTVSGRRPAALVRDRCGGERLAHEVDVVARVLPSEASGHVVDHLVDRKSALDDPLYRLVFPHRDMLAPEDFRAVEKALDDPAELRAAVAAVRSRLNLHPGGKLTRDIPHQDGERVGGRHVAVMLHLSHPGELEPEIARRAVAALRDVGAHLRSRAPVVRHVNDSSSVWSDAWRAQLALGIHPYYLFVGRDTGARRHFGLSLERAYEIHRGAVRPLSGLGRAARGPVMSTAEGKVSVDGVTELPGGRAFTLRHLQARRPELVDRPFPARWGSEAQWWSELTPFGAYDRTFFPGGGAAADARPAAP